MLATTMGQRILLSYFDFVVSIFIHGDKAKEDEVRTNIPVQEKTVTLRMNAQIVLNIFLVGRPIS